MAFNSLIKSRDIFDELLVENQRLLNELLFANNCVNKLQTLLTQIYHKFDPQLSEEETHKVNEVKQELLILAAKQVVKREPIEKSSPKSRKRVSQWTSPADLLITDMTTDDSVVDYRLIGNNKTGIKKQRTKLPKVETNMDSNVEDCEPERHTSRLVVDDSDRVVKKRFRKKRSDECTPEELEEIRHKYTSREGIRDDLTGQYVCPKSGCIATYDNIRTFYKHLVGIHGMDPIGVDDGFQVRMDAHTSPYFDGQRYVCAEIGCDQQFDKQLTFYRHLTNDHQFVPDIVCEYCHKVFKKYCLYKSHKRIHTDDRPFKCIIDGCDYQCRTKVALNTHLRHHSDQRPYRCDYPNCLKTYKDASHLSYHRKSHNPDYQLKCYVDGCDQKFKNRDRRTLHIKQVHQGLTADECKKVRKQFQCDWPGCEYTGPRMSVTTHKMIHTDERPFPCEWTDCGKRFRLKQHLTDHLNTHLNIKPLACHWPGCAYRCNDSGNLRKHVRTSHK